MNAPSILISPVHSAPQLDLCALSDQALMELFVGELDSVCLEAFKDANGSVKDKCKWRGVKCNVRRQVKEIRWEDRVFAGTFNFAFLPPSTTIVFMSHLGKNQANTPGYACGTLDTSALPCAIEDLTVGYQQLHGSVDFRRLPVNLSTFVIEQNDFSGRIHLEALPKRLYHLHAAGNEFSGSISLVHLPESLWDIDLSDNVLSGSLDLLHLPDKLTNLDLHANCFTGSVSFARLPRRLLRLNLDENNLSGKFVYVKKPRGIHYLKVRGNLFRGTSVVSREAISSVYLNQSAMEHIVDENNEPYAEDFLSYLRERKLNF